MKTTLLFIFLLLSLISINCTDDSMDVQRCYEGTVIGKIRSAGGGVAVNMETPGLSTHEWNGFQHVVEALNIPRDFWVPGQKLYFTARPATREEQGPVTADGNESVKPLIFVITFSTVDCPEGTEKK